MTGTYTHGHAPSVLRSHTWRTAANSAGYLLPHLRPSDELLDVGCGPGTITADLARLVTRTVGIEVVEEPLVAARALGSAAQFRLGDVMALEPGQADVVHAHQVLQHLTDPVGALRSMAGASRRLVAARDADYAAMFWYPAIPALERWRAVYRAVARSNGAEPDAGRRLLAWAHAAGLTDVTASVSTWCYATAEERAWWGDLWAERTTSTRLAEQAVTRGLATQAELAEMADGWRTWAASPDGWFAVPNGEILARV